MNDICMEYMIKKKKDKKDILFIAGILTAGVIISLVLFAVMYAAAIALMAQQIAGFAFSIGFVIIAFIWYGAYLLMSSRNVEYEYSLINSEIDVDKIMSKRGRKRIISLDFSEAEIVACIEDNEHNHSYKNPNKQVKLYNAVADTNKGYVYFVDFYHEGEASRLLFQPTGKMIEAIKKFNPRNVFIMQ